jgi:quaternary ammonium compound-resistance protein SugE
MSTTLAWVLLLVAGFFEVIWAYFLKQSVGFTKIVPTSLFFLSLAVSMALLAYAMRNIPLSMAYPIWTGIGAVGSILVGVFFFHESLGFVRILFLSFILIGIIGLKAVA